MHFGTKSEETVLDFPVMDKLNRRMSKILDKPVNDPADEALPMTQVVEPAAVETPVAASKKEPKGTKKK